jgi:uncharacterized delta-60 repeat protein
MIRAIHNAGTARPRQRRENAPGGAGVRLPGSRTRPGAVCRSSIFVLLFLLPLHFVRAQSPGSVDTNFTAVFSSYPTIHSILVQPDARILVGGQYDTADGVLRGAVARLNSNGTLDTNFVNPRVSGTAHALALQSDGKVVVGGTFFNIDVGNRNNLGRLNSDGTLDANYPNTTSNPIGANNGIYAISLQQSDGKALIGGTFTVVNGTNRTGFARLNTDGSLDFGYTNQIAFYGFDPQFGAARISAIAVQPADGKAIIGGNFRTLNSAPRTNLARLNLDGTVDTNFNRVILGGDATVYAVALQADGKILLGGQFTSVNGNPRTNLARLNTDGSLDSTFQNGMGGANIPPSIGPAYVTSVLPLEHGLILVGGYFTAVNGAARTNIAQLDSTGSLDATFDAGGALANNTVNSLVAHTNGYVLVGCNASGTQNATNAVIRLYAGLYTLTMCDPIALPAGRSKADLDPANPPLVTPPTRTFWDATTSTLYPTNAGDFTVIWNFKTPPLQVTNIGFIVPPPTNTYTITQEIFPPGCADPTQVPVTASGAYYHALSHKVYATAPGLGTVTWKRANGSLVPQPFLAQWPSDPAQFQIHVANSALVDVTGGGQFGFPALLGQDPGTGATLVNNQFAAASAGRSLLLVSAAGAAPQATNIFFQLVQTILWNDPTYFRDTNTATIGQEIVDPAHNPACGSPFVLDYLGPSFPARICMDARFYDRTNRAGPIVPVNRSASGMRSDDLLLVLYQFGSRLKDPLTGHLLSNSVAWPYLPTRYLSVWPANPDTIFIAGGQGSGPVTLPDANWSVYRQPNTNQFGYNPNEEHAFRFTAAPAPVQLKVSVSALMVAAGDSVPVLISLAGDPGYAPQSPVTVSISGDRDGDTNLFVVFPTDAVGQQLTFWPSNWFVPQNISFAAGQVLGSGSNTFVIRATGGLAGEASVQVLGAPTNQPALVLDALAFDVSENSSRSVHVRLAQPPPAPVTVTTINRGTPADRPVLRVESGATLVFNATNWNLPQAVSIHADPDPDSVNDLAVFTVQASGGLTETLSFLATQADTTVAADAVYALRNDLGDAFGTTAPVSSEPYVLLKYTNSVGQGLMKVYRVLAEDANHRFLSYQKAGQLLQAPNPLTTLPKCPNTVAVSGPYFRDKNADHWAKAAGISNNLPAATNIILHYFYHPFATASAIGFDPPAGGASYSGNECLPWLDQYAGSPGTPIDYTFTITWPDNVPQLQVGETLVKPKFGLPNIANQCSVDVIYEQTGPGTLVQLFDPLALRVFPVSNLPGNKLPSEIVTQVDPADQKLVFMQVPLTLRKRLKFNPNTIPPQLEFGGYYNETDYVGDPLLLPNVMTLAEANALKSLSANATYRAAIDALRAITVAAQAGVSSLGSQFKALSAATAPGPGYVALAMQNSGACGALPVSVEIIKVACPLYQGDIKPIYADCAFDETLTLRHSADFAGNGDNYSYEWFYRRSGTANWIALPGQTNQDITISGPGLRTLEDYEYYCHYRPLSGTVCGTGFSPDTHAQLAEGWIKRVLRGVNPFTQVTADFHVSSVDTTASMIQQAGSRWEGDIALNCLPGNQFGLIQAYETVLRRGIDLSIGAGIPLTDDTALRLAAGQLSDLYLLLGNEAYADAQDPTIGFGTDSGQYTASSIFCFQGQVNSLLQEELTLLRGRDGPYGADNSPGTRVDVSPVYNRLYWNFGPDQPGQTAYVLNYNITDKDGSGVVNATDARIMFPQGHGDAWGHYLSAIMAYYQLFSNPNYTWVPEYESVNINGADVQVNYQHERKFAKIAAARARTGAEIVNLTYRSLYTEDPTGQWLGYHDGDTNRAWGVSEWASRAGQAALFDWIAGNALLPDKDVINPPLTRVDRTTVSELRELAASFVDLQQVMDTADEGLNPLGLDKNVVPFGIDPGALLSGQTHFDQIYGRAIGAMNNAIAVFNYANQPTQLLRRQQDSLADFQRNVVERLTDFTNRLIEIYGYPYNEDIGGGGAYPVGYTGPDLFHFNYVDVTQLAGVDPPTTQTITVGLQDLTVGADGTLSRNTLSVPFNFASDTVELQKPAGFTSRLAPGEIQRSLGDLLQARIRFQQAVVGYNNLVTQIEDQAGLIHAEQGLNAQSIQILNQAAGTQRSLNDQIAQARVYQLEALNAARMATLVADGTAEALPKSVGLSSDVTAPTRSAIRLAGAFLSEGFNAVADVQSMIELEHQQAKEDAQTASNIELTATNQAIALLPQVAQLRQLVRQEAVQRYDLFNLREAVHQAAGNYLAILARGNRLLEDRVRFLQETAAQVQAYRYKDMAFRIFRNDALQKYRAQFDLAARYVYLAAKAYDYETGLLQTSSKSGSAFLEDIVKKRAIGTIQNGLPVPGTTGDSGLAAPMAAMGQNYATIKANLGLNNQITRQRLFSLRSGWFRIGNQTTNSVIWQQTLRRSIVNNIWDIPEFQRYCRPLRPEPNSGHEPAMVIIFPSEIIAEDNFFGWPAGGGDSAYNASVYSTKILSAGIWFSSYDSTANGLVQYPSAWLVPAGEDVVRAAGANDFSYRHWKVFDQKIPVPNNFATSPPDFSANWIPINFSLSDQFGAVGGQRQYSSIDATTESQSLPLDTAHMQTDSGLIGRSVWNTQWMLIVPGVGLLGSNPDEGIERFISGALINGQRTGNGVTDIKIYFTTYSYSGF